MGRRGLPQELHQGDHRSDQDAAKEPGRQHPGKGQHRHQELRTILAPEALEGRELEEAGHRNQHDRGQDGLRQAAEELAT